MNLTNNLPVYAVFGSTVIPVLYLTLRFLFKLQTSGEILYQNRASMQSNTIDEMAKQITELRKSDDECRKLRSQLQLKVDELEEKIFQLELKLGTG